MDEQFYVGIKLVKARPMTKGGKPGYAVQYEDGHQSWSPKETFEKAYCKAGHDKLKAGRILQYGKEAVTDMVDALT